MQTDTKPMKRNLLLIDLRLWLGDFTDVVLKCYFRALYTETIPTTKRTGYFWN